MVSSEGFLKEFGIESNQVFEECCFLDVLQVGRMDGHIRRAKFSHDLEALSARAEGIVGICDNH